MLKVFENWVQFETYCLVFKVIVIAEIAKDSITDHIMNDIKQIL